MIAKLAEPRIGTNVPRPFPHVCVGGGVWEQVETTLLAPLTC